jgi:hypothetical protein
MRAHLLHSLLHHLQLWVQAPQVVPDRPAAALHVRHDGSDQLILADAVLK